MNTLHLRYRRTYSWNERNQLVLSVDANYTTSYIYSHDGERTNKYTSSGETLYFNKMWSLHTDAGNSIHGGQYAKNVYLGETRIVTKLCLKNDPRADAEELQQYYYHSDHLGSASLISDYKGDEYQRIEYTPYGETWIERTDNKGLEYLPYKFTAKELDPETGLYYYGARYLDSKYSTWISTDPALGEYIPQAPVNDEAKRHNQNLPGMGGIFNHINTNLYAYAANNPVHYIDPDGRKTRTSEIKALIDLMGTKPNKPISSDFLFDFSKEFIYIGNDPEKINDEKLDLQTIAVDDTTMIDSKKILLTKTIEKKVEQDLGEQLNYTEKKYFGLNTLVDDRNANRTETLTLNVTVRIYSARTISPDGKESDVYKSFIDFNDDENIDFIYWGKVKIDE